MPGPPNVLTVGSVTTAPPGSLADAAVSGVSPAQRLDLVIPRGDKGEKGDTGAINTLTVGPVTTGPAGTAAAATLVGAAPNQRLDLTIPQGLMGYTRTLVETGGAYPPRPAPANDPVMFIGVTSPAALMLDGDVWINLAASEVPDYERGLEGRGRPEGVVAAPVGMTYTDLDATNGAVKWVKVSGAGTIGWKVQYGDTGQRGIANDPTYGVAVPGHFGPTQGQALANSAVKVRRYGDVVHMEIHEQALQPKADYASTARTMFNMPPGFRPQMTQELIGKWGNNTGDTGQTLTAVFVNGSYANPCPVVALPLATANWGGLNLGGAWPRMYAGVWVTGIYLTAEPWPSGPLPGVAL
jgi:hypothetical protein